MRFVNHAVLVGVLGLLILTPATAAQAAAGADLSVTIRPTGHGPLRTPAGGTVTLAVSVTNHGPSRASDVVLLGSGSDHFNVVSTTCDDVAPLGNTTARCPDLAPGETVTGTLVLEACCFPVGETRRAFGDVTVTSSTPDPDPTDNFAVVDIRIIGPHQRS